MRERDLSFDNLADRMGDARRLERFRDGAGLHPCRAAAAGSTRTLSVGIPVCTSVARSTTPPIMNRWSRWRGCARRLDSHLHAHRRWTQRKKNANSEVGATPIDGL